MRFNFLVELKIHSSGRQKLCKDCTLYNITSATRKRRRRELRRPQANVFTRQPAASVDVQWSITCTVRRRPHFGSHGAQCTFVIACCLRWTFSAISAYREGLKVKSLRSIWWRGLWNEIVIATRSSDSWGFRFQLRIAFRRQFRLQFATVVAASVPIHCLYLRYSLCYYSLIFVSDSIYSWPNFTSQRMKDDHDIYVKPGCSASINR
jgi:hypothetical protein